MAALFAVLFTLLQPVAQATSATSFCDAISGWETLWVEEFDGSELDLSAWTIDTQAGAPSRYFPYSCIQRHWLSRPLLTSLQG